MNPYFMNSQDLTAGTRARASGVEDNFDQVEGGFDLVEADMALKAPLASPAFTGTPSAPTPAVGDNSTRIATTASVLAEVALGIATASANGAAQVAAATAQANIATTQAGIATTQATNAATSASAAATAAATAVNSPGTSGTSTTSIALGYGTKTVITQTGKLFVPGQYVVFARTSDAANFRMGGVITAYNSGTGSITAVVDEVVGTGTFADWTVANSPARSPAQLPVQVVNTSTVCVPNIHYVIGTGGITLTMPTPSSPYDRTAVTNASGTTTAICDFGSTLVKGQSVGAMRMDNRNASFELRFSNNVLYGWA